MEYKRPDVGLKIYREALARFTEFSNLRLGVYTPYANEKRIQSLIMYMLLNVPRNSSNIHKFCSTCTGMAKCKKTCKYTIMISEILFSINDICRCSKIVLTVLWTSLGKQKSMQACLGMLVRNTGLVNLISVLHVHVSICY